MAINTSDLEFVVGPRATAIVTSVPSTNRNATKKWLRDNGVYHEVAGALSLAELTDIVRDETDGLLNHAKDSGTVEEYRAALSKPTMPVPPKPTPAPAPAPSPTLDTSSLGLGILEGAIKTLVVDVVNSTPSGVNEDEVKGIVKGILDAEGIDESKIKCAVAKAIRDAGVQDLIDAVNATAGTTARTPVVVTAAKGSKIMAQIAPFYVPGKDSGTQIMLTSPPSFGKSHTIRQLGQTYDVYLEHGCSDDLDEVTTLLGNPSPDEDGGFIVFDGVIVEAVRAAAEGKSVLLLLDEVLRLPTKAQEWLLMFMTGYEKADGSVWYRLRTRRVEDRKLEVIEAPATHFHLISATNLGLINPVEAFWSRWETCRIEWNEADATAIGQSIMDSFGILAPAAPAKPRLANAFAKLIGESRRALKEGKVNKPIDFRILKRACKACPDPTERGIAEFMARRITNNCASWDGDTGDMDAESKGLTEGWATTLKSIHGAV
jgi:hypothetical protein